MAHLYRNHLILGLGCTACGHRFSVDYHSEGFTKDRGACPACGVEHTLRARDLRAALEPRFRSVARRVRGPNRELWRDIVAVVIANAALLLKPVLLVIVVHFFHQHIGNYILHTQNLLNRLIRAGYGEALLFAMPQNPNTESNRYVGEKWEERFVVMESAIRAFHLLEEKQPSPAWWNSFATDYSYMMRDQMREYLLLISRFDYGTFPHHMDLRIESLKWFPDTGLAPEDNHTRFTFSPAENENADKRLARLGLSRDKPYAAFFGRDAGYHTTRGIDSNYEKDYSRHSNTTIANYLPAMRWLADNGVSSVRLGRHVRDPLPSDRPEIIDYANLEPDDWTDVDLVANSLFTVSVHSGSMALALILNKWQLICNFLFPFTTNPIFREEKFCFMFKKLWCHKERRFLSFREIFARRLEFYIVNIPDYFKAGVTPVENSPGELLDGIRETHARATGAWVTTPEEQELQDRFRRLLRETYSGFDVNIACRLSFTFLKCNPFLLADA